MKENYKEYFKRLLIIAVPLILGNIINQLQMLIDRVFLGNANSIYMSVLGNVIFPVWLLALKTIRIWKNMPALL